MKPSQYLILVSVGIAVLASPLNAEPAASKPARSQANGTRDWQGHLCESGAVTSISSLRGKAECVIRDAPQQQSEATKRIDAWIDHQSAEFFRKDGDPPIAPLPADPSDEFAKAMQPRPGDELRLPPEAQSQPVPATETASTEREPDSLGELLVNELFKGLTKKKARKTGERE